MDSLPQRPERFLIIVGNLTENKYVTKLVGGNKSNRIRFLGSIYDKSELNSLRYACKAYIHGHSVGGTIHLFWKLWVAGTLLFAMIMFLTAK